MRFDQRNAFKAFLIRELRKQGRSLQRMWGLLAALDLPEIWPEGAPAPKEALPIMFYDGRTGGTVRGDMSELAAEFRSKADEMRGVRQLEIETL